MINNIVVISGRECDKGEKSNTQLEHHEMKQEEAMTTSDGVADHLATMQQQIKEEELEPLSYAIGEKDDRQQNDQDQQIQTDKTDIYRELILRHLIADISGTCTKLGLSTELYSWSGEDCRRWVAEMCGQFQLSTPPEGNAAFTGLNGRCLSALGVDEFLARFPDGGDTLHAQLQLWKTAFESCGQPFGGSGGPLRPQMIGGTVEEAAVAAPPPWASSLSIVSSSPAFCCPSSASSSSSCASSASYQQNRHGTPFLGNPMPNDIGIVMASSSSDMSSSSSASAHTDDSSSVGDDEYAVGGGPSILSSASSSSTSSASSSFGHLSHHPQHFFPSQHHPLHQASSFIVDEHHHHQHSHLSLPCSNFPTLPPPFHHNHHVPPPSHHQPPSFAQIHQIPQQHSTAVQHQRKVQAARSIVILCAMNSNVCNSFVRHDVQQPQKLTCPNHEQHQQNVIIE